MNKSKRIVFVTGQLYVIGGVERILVDKANYLADILGYSVWFISVFQDETQEDVYELSPNVHGIKLDCEFKPTTSFRKNPLSFISQWHKWRVSYKSALHHAIEQINPDVLFCTTFVDWGFAKNTHNLVVESHVTRVGCLLTKEKNILNKISDYLQNRYWERIAHILVCLTIGDAKNWKGNVKVIPNFTNITPVRPIDYSAIRVIAAGRICEQKGFDILVEAWKKVVATHPDWHLDIYGEGKTHHVEALKRLITERSLGDHITLCGVSKNMAEAYADHSIFVFPSRWEGFGLVLLEAMTCGLPSVAADCQYGPRDIMCGDKADTDCGILVPTEDPQSLTEALNYLIEHPDTRAQMGTAAMLRAQYYDKDRIMKQWDELITSIS